MATSLTELPELRWAALAVVLFAAGSIAEAAGAPWWALAVLFGGCYASGGWEPGLTGLRALAERTLDVDLLMVVAALVAAAIGQVLDGALLIVIFATSGALEAVATRRTEDSVRDLLDLAPEAATKVDRDGVEVRVATADLEVGDVIVTRPGELIGADGLVVEGSGDVLQASITGEPMPVDKGCGDEVYAGTVNGSGLLHVQVSRRASDSVVARIAALVEQASATKATTQLFIDRVEQRYSIAMVSATVLLLAIPLLLGADLRPTLLRAMTFMIVASPCGVVLATMPPLLSAIASAGRHGVLVKSAVVMERLADTTRVAFDKTGTLTEGKPHVDHAIPTAPGWAPADLLALAASVEQASEHPLGRAVVDAARSQGLPLTPVAGFRATPGEGVRGRVAGVAAAVRRPRAGDPVITTELEADAATAVVVERDGEVIGVLGLADRPRRDADRAVRLLAESVGAPVLLTGDAGPAGQQLASHVGILDVRTGLLPEGKVQAVEAWQGDGDRVLLVGDGINDAPALAAAHVGVAMGQAGADLTLEAADAVIVRDELTTLPAMIHLSRQARTLVIQNLVIAGLVICGLVAWDLVGTLPLPLGVAGHEGSTVVIGLNGLRLLRRSAWRHAEQPPRRPFRRR